MVVLNAGLRVIENNAGMYFENILLLLVALGGLIFYARDFKIGIILHMLGFGCLFMLYYALGLNYAKALTAFFLCFIILCITLYAVAKTSPYMNQIS